MKIFVACDDGRNDVACWAKTKKEALLKMNVYAYFFNGYGYVYDEKEDFPNFLKIFPKDGNVYYKPTSISNKEYPWRLTRYYIRWDENGMSYYI